MRKSQATVLVELADDLELFHDGERGYAVVEVGDHRETWPVRSTVLRGLLRRRYWETTRSAPNSEAVMTAVGVIEARALYDGPANRVHLRVADLGPAIVVDLADEKWRAVEVTAQGWELVTEPIVRFRRTRGMRVLPEPVRGGSLEDLRPLLHLASDDDYVLIVAWLVAALSGRGPYPVLVLHGEQGSGKTTVARLLRSLVDPSISPVRAEPKDERDLMVGANAAHVLALDNLSRVQPWLSDALCRIATGGGFSTRELYTDDEEIIFDARRPIILTGIEELATRADLLDRSIIIYLPGLRDDQRLDERTFWRAVEDARPRILGGLLDALSVALRNHYLRLLNPPRMADFARLVVAAEPALPWPPGKFIQSYCGNRDAADELALEASGIAAEIRKLELPWSGTASELLEALRRNMSEEVRRSRGWPSTPRALTNALRRISPNLRKIGTQVAFLRGGHPSRRLITLSAPSERAPAAASAASLIAGNVQTRDLFGDVPGDSTAGVSGSTEEVPQGDEADAADATTGAFSDGAADGSEALRELLVDAAELDVRFRVEAGILVTEGELSDSMRGRIDRHRDELLSVLAGREPR